MKRQQTLRAYRQSITRQSASVRLAPVLHEKKAGYGSEQAQNMRLPRREEGSHCLFLMLLKLIKKAWCARALLSPGPPMVQGCGYY
ncbi:hypothetical protein P1P91_04045 [Halomonas piscis]|uniref:Uncharacterized protein n=1 Tax=Halomonas piscis TaxID=3031727 RepID=A0ABY9Z2L9_9GAMM|nr:hypothetical protein [Halomonas piscis]WNK20860.1 hypothetical protein P1P91_04045 [Halomonas piscis]